MLAKVITLAALLMLTPVAGAGADDYPSRPVRIVVPYPAGGPSDVAMRLLAEPLSRQLGQSIVIENRSGGAGQIGVEAAVQADRDGYTLVVGGLATQVLIPTIKTTRYDPAHDFIPLGQISSAPQILALRSSLGLKTMAEVIAHAKAYPGKFTVGSAGVGTEYASGDPVVGARGRDRSHARPLSQHDALGERCRRQPDRFRFRRAEKPSRPDRGGHAGADRGRLVAAHPATAEPTDHGGSRPARRADRELVWIDGAGPHAAGHNRTSQEGSPRGAGRSRLPGAARTRQHQRGRTRRRRASPK